MLFTEHDMDAVFAHADRILVLVRGEIIAAGTPEEVRANPEVQRVYLGTSGLRAALRRRHRVINMPHWQPPAPHHLLDAGQELLHCGNQLFLQQGDLLLSRWLEWTRATGSSRQRESSQRDMGSAAVAQRWDASSTAGSGKGRAAPRAALAPADDGRSHRQPQRG